MTRRRHERNKLAICFVADMVWPIWIFRVADMVFGCGRYRCCRYRRTPMSIMPHTDNSVRTSLAAVPLYDAAFQMTRFVKQSHGHGLTSSP